MRRNEGCHLSISYLFYLTKLMRLLLMSFAFITNVKVDTTFDALWLLINIAYVPVVSRHNK